MKKALKGGNAPPNSAAPRPSVPYIEPTTPKGTSVMDMLQRLNPYRVLQEAIRAVPAMRYALGVLGIIAVIAIISAWRIDLKVAVFGVIIGVCLMGCILLFARLVAIAPQHFLLP